MTYNDLEWHLGRSCEPKKIKKAQKIKRGPTNQPTNRRTDKAGCRVAEHATKKLIEKITKSRFLAAVKI